VAEWLKAAALKAVVRATVPWVRIPPSPPLLLKPRNLGNFQKSKRQMSVVFGGFLLTIQLTVLFILILLF
jgi:hypothetical protein